MDEIYEGCGPRQMSLYHVLDRFRDSIAKRKNTGSAYILTTPSTAVME